eukprot:jgi/Galph1/546/GphlegSOOS_G5145.1
MIKKTSSTTSSPAVSPSKEDNTSKEGTHVVETPPQSQQDSSTNSPPSSPGRLQRSLDVMAQIYSNNSDALRKRQLQLIDSVDSLSCKTKQVLSQFIPETLSPLKFSSSVDRMINELAVTSATKQSWDKTRELVEREVEPVSRDIEYSIQSLGKQIWTLIAAVFTTISIIYRASSQIADALWHPFCFKFVSPSSSQGEHSWSTTDSLQERAMWKRFVFYLLEIVAFLLALPIACFRLVQYQVKRLFAFSNNSGTDGTFRKLFYKLWLTAKEWILFGQELLAFFHFMFGCLAVYCFELVKDYKGPGASLIHWIPKVLPKSLQAYIVDDADGQQTQGDYNAELDAPEPERVASRPNCAS